MAALWTLVLTASCMLTAIPDLAWAGHSSGSSSSSSSEASVSSSEESLSARLESRIHRCVRGASPGLVLPVGNFEQLTKVEACADDGMSALFGGTPAPAVKDQINGCVDGKAFPDAVMPAVNLFKDCVTRALT
ncbi:hypothetical protein FOCC_FOCC016907 [Frankliniella occidentalis]|uniref:Uncharacterized protein LOC113208193 n=1 Tax=Frankliniella occidentalis TaxID=133901 RepID=A0A9C6X9N5_FRAOC|nr:uncharacterized protein LOC113208193 [Frankliniella occidentalis]KAE8737628.1 hypothetical protein FOCC_FOCC016907 [Frankliniella occidentalis]